MKLKKAITCLLFICICNTIVAQLQLERSTYKAFKVSEKKKDDAPNLMDIFINEFPSGKIISFSDKKKEPLNGCYHIIIHGEKYVIANIKNGLLDGEGTLYWYNKVGEKAFFKQGKYDGEAHEYYKGHEVTTFKDGIIQHYIAHHPNGQLKEERFYENGKLQGEVKQFDEDGNLHWEGNFSQGKRDGKFVETDNNTYTTISYYKNDKLDGEYLEQFKNGKIAQKGKYNNGKKTDRWVKYNEDGQTKEDVGYLDDEYHGEKRSYSQGELHMLIEYDHGKYHGKYIIYNTSNPPLIEIEKNYAHNKLDGYTKHYTEKGILHLEILYRDGKEVIRKDYDYNSGIINTEHTYRNNNVIREKVYDKNGKLKILRLANEYGSLVDVQEYNTAGKVIKTNTEYKKPASIKLKEDTSGIIDIEIE